MPGNIYVTTPIAGHPVPPPPVRQHDVPPEAGDDDAPAINAPVRTIPSPVTPNQYCVLTNTNPPHNKFYRITVVCAEGDEYRVNVQFGRCNTLGRTLIKFIGPVAGAIHQANAIRAGKIREGYTHDSGVEAFVISIPRPQASSVFIPPPIAQPQDPASPVVPSTAFQPVNVVKQSREAVDEAFAHYNVVQLARSDDRCFLRKVAGAVFAYANGRAVTISDGLRHRCLRLSAASFELDGFLVDGRFEAIDVIEIDSIGKIRIPLIDRLQLLLTKGITLGGKESFIAIAPIACSVDAKKKLITDAQRNSLSLFVRKDESKYASAPATVIQCGRRCAF